ncbi:DUF5331 domain-containing protein [Trichormus variabilis]|uniref:DUF5331 domain-containing protein n=1 Tax=Trichormus variabilis SAG 1403-4b TaxID=447716 RepID=A0A3S1ATJ4_ANAVA|nr:DUF5331 domain-containing protein [Trichormus variabilis]MBD2625695.1 DUF5331 domain-containing protein [Trichormus variabilis FACHB-164]RUS98977.1 hypothetical protein DSM107003_09960 [Trichormus variabilis SAG 1403-4b]
MAFFDNFTDTLKQKWLQFFQVNRDWITLQMAVESVYTPDGGKRPSSYLILGVVNALEPKLAQLMLPFAKLNPDADTLIEVLELNFDPDIVLGNRFSPTVEPPFYSNGSAVVTDDTTEEEPLEEDDLNGFGEVAISQEFTIIDDTEQSWVEDESLENEEGLDDMYSSSNNLSEESEPTSSLEAEDAFGEISFDSMTLIEDSDDLNPPDESAFRDVLSDVWGDETSLEEGEENNDLLGEELPSEVFDESEMARLFPNS